MGASRHPVFPAPSVAWRAVSWHHSDAIRAARRRGCVASSIRGFCRVGKAKRAHHYKTWVKMVGTAQMRLCPPYKLSRNDIGDDEQRQRTPCASVMLQCYALTDGRSPTRANQAAMLAL